MSKQAVSPDQATPVALAVAVMGKAMGALSRANGAVWRSIQEASGAFPATMTDEDKRVLSGQLAADYRKRAALDNASVLASQHARAIFLIATGARAVDGKTPDPAKFSNMSAFFGAFSTKPAKTVTPPHPGASVTGGTKPVHRADAGNAPDNAAPKGGDVPPIDRLMAQQVVSVHGLPAEVASALQDLVAMMRAQPQLQDAVVMMRNNPALLLQAAEAETLRQRESMAAKLSEASAGTAMGAALGAALVAAGAQADRKRAARQVA